jgi:hypothetical protein
MTKKWPSSHHENKDRLSILGFENENMNGTVTNGIGRQQHMTITVAGWKRSTQLLNNTMQYWCKDEVGTIAKAFPKQMLKLCNKNVVGRRETWKERMEA